jgi:membrane-bound lytic murein transglycosylase D
MTTVALAFMAVACAQPIRSTRPQKEDAPAQPITETTSAPAAPQEARPDEESLKDAQQLFDEALEFLQAAQNYWGQGDIDNAIAALDQAYSLILSADPGEDPELIRQQEDIRIMVCKRMLEIYASRHTVANGKYDAIPKITNPHIEKELKRFSGPEKKFFLNSYRRSGRFRPAIVAALKAAGLPEDLAWLPLIESGFKIRALSPARALGLWQFIPSTGFRFGLKRNEWIDERMDALKATKAAIGYLQELHRIFGDWYSVLAAYNCGESRVLREIRRQNINYLDNFWDLYERLPRETAGYVPRFLATLIILNDPKKYGFELKTTDPPMAFETARISKQVRLKDLARALKVPLKEMEALNAELRHRVTPPGPYDLKVPPGKAVELNKILAKIPTYVPAQKLFSYHQIKKGETLSHLARIYKTTIDNIAKMNKIKVSDPLRIGQRLKVPITKKTAKPVRTTRPAVKPSAKIVRYKVKKGDSMWLLAQRYNTTLDAIKLKNNLKTTDLHTGQELLIPTGTRKSIPRANTKSYKVQPGDTPYQIARKHNMKLEEFLRLNKLTPRSKIFPGQELLVTP